MTMQGYQQAYQQVQNVTENPRQTEYRLFAQVTAAMMQAEKQGHAEVVRAVHWNRRLWLTLQADCASESNGLPDAMRAGIISLAIWVDKHSRKALKREADLQPMVEVNRNIMEGLADQQVVANALEIGDILDAGGSIGRAEGSAYQQAGQPQNSAQPGSCGPLRRIFIVRFHYRRDPYVLDPTKSVYQTAGAILPRPPLYMRKTCQFRRKIYLFKINGLGVFSGIDQVSAVIIAY